MLTDKENHNVAVVIGRQFGSGGRRIGHLLAERLDAPYYDKELLLEAAGECGISREMIASADEKRPSALRWLLQAAYGARDSFGSDALTESIYSQVAGVIKNISAKGSCVIVGRTADYILRDNPLLVSVFLHAPIAHRVKTLMERGEHKSEQQAAEAARKADRQRENYYNYFTGRKWGQADNYHICVDASCVDDETIVETIVSYIEARKKYLRQR